VQASSANDIQLRNVPPADRLTGTDWPGIGPDAETYAATMSEVIRVRRHVDLAATELDALRSLFDSEYRNGFGSCNPDGSYGYAPEDTHVLAFRGQALAAHVGFQCRRIAVGTGDVMVAGIGGVLVDERSRGTGLGRRVMRHAQKVMRGETGVDCGFLGCRREVVPL
jgi:aminoglycoside 2'-N-acetyltransferase I